MYRRTLGRERMSTWEATCPVCLERVTVVEGTLATHAIRLIGRYGHCAGGGRSA